jgi:hypothetical protein
MQSTKPLARMVLGVVSAGCLVLPPLARAQGAAPRAESPVAAAVAACEGAARKTLAAQGVQAVEVAFDTAPVMRPRLAGDDTVVLNGAGRSRGAGGIRNFAYSCSVDARSSEIVGLVLRDSTPAKAAAPPAPAPAEPDLSRLSPAACESSAVAALEKRWPQVTKISFDIATRSFRQQDGNAAELHGSGHAIPTAGAPSTLFVFDCAIDPRDGRVIRTTVSG